MRRNIAIGIGILIIVVGSVWLYVRSGSVSQTSTDQNEQTNTNDVNGGDKTATSSTPTETVKTSTIPKGYKDLHPRSEALAQMPDTFEKRQRDLFDETVKTLMQHPDSVWGWITLGGVKQSFGDYEGAESAWLYATKLAPQHTASYGNLGDLYWHYLKNYPRAEWAFLQFLKYDPSSAAHYRDLADLYRYDYKEKSDQVVPLMLSGLAKNKENPDLLSYLAQYYYQTGDMANSIVYYKRLVAADPANKQAVADLADLLAGRRIGPH